jgi:CheY-like chemotaxis protein/anti-anti-sigma regulatory factor
LNVPRPTILVIDDEAATLTMFRLFLRAYGYEVLTAENGSEALDLLHRERPGIVFTDLKMPEMDGFEVLKRIKQSAPETQVIVMTGHGDMDLAVQALNLDATDFINKPIKRSALESALKRAEKRLEHPVPVTGSVEFSRERGFAVVTIRGTLRRDNRQDLIRVAGAAREMAPAGVLIQFSDHAAFDGSGISELINVLSGIRKNGQPVAISGLSENFTVISEMVGLTRFTVLCDSEEEAMAALASSAESG